MSSRVGWQEVGEGGLRVALVRVTEERVLRPVDAVVLPMGDEALEEAAQWAEVAAAARLEQGAAALRRHHHRRMEDLFIAWCDAVTELGREELAEQAVAVLQQTQRIAPALEALEAGHDALLWRRLGKQRGGATASARNELSVRWRIHHRFSREVPLLPQDLLPLVPLALKRGQAGRGD